MLLFEVKNVRLRQLKQKFYCMWLSILRAWKRHTELYVFLNELEINIENINETDLCVILHLGIQFRGGYSLEHTGRNTRTYEMLHSCTPGNGISVSFWTNKSVKFLANSNYERRELFNVRNVFLRSHYRHKKNDLSYRNGSGCTSKCHTNGMCTKLFNMSTRMMFRIMMFWKDGAGMFIFSFSE